MTGALALAALLAAAAVAQPAAVDPIADAARIPKIVLGKLVLVGDDHPNFDLSYFPPTVTDARATARRPRSCSFPF